MRLRMASRAAVKEIRSGIDPGVVCGVADQGADRLVAAEHGVDLLADHRRGLRPQDDGGAAAERGLQLTEAGLQLPAGRVGGRGLLQRQHARDRVMSVTRVKVSEISAAVLAGHRVLDDPDGDAGDVPGVRALGGASAGRRPGRRSATGTCRRAVPPAPAGPRRFSRATARAPRRPATRRAAHGTGSCGRPAAGRRALSWPSSCRASGCSPVASARRSAPSTARVPHSPRPTTRICGNGPGPGVVARVSELRAVLLA